MSNVQSLFFHTEVSACIADLPADAPARERYEAIKLRGREALRQHKESLQTQLRANCRVAALTLVVEHDELYRLDQHEELGAFIRAPKADAYADVLKTDGKVVASFAERKASIAAQLDAKAAELKATINPSEGLLDKITSLVE